MRDNTKFSQVATDSAASIELLRLIAEKKLLREQEGTEGIDLSKEIGILHGKIFDLEKAQAESNFKLQNPLRENQDKVSKRVNSWIGYHVTTSLIKFMHIEWGRS